jgi:two-component system, sensor histidine kinase and response regulator
MRDQLNILVVDDDEVDRMAVRRAFAKTDLQLELVEAIDCASATTALEEDFDCVFLDYRLPDQDGLTFIKTMRQTGDKTPVIVLTSQGDEQIAVELMKAGASDYLPKSKISPETLALVLRNAVRVYRAEMQVELTNQRLRESNALLRRKNQELEDLVFRLTHDLRTPLVAADRMLRLFQQEAFCEISQEMKDAIAAMIGSNQALLQMTNTLLEVYRYEVGQKNLTLLPCNLTAIAQEVVQELKPLADEKGIDITLESDDYDRKQVLGDRLELRRVIINLLGNAIKFTDRGTIGVRVCVPTAESTLQNASRVILEVSDTGTGISPDDQVNLFQRFRQGNHRRSGSGLGLYLSRQIVEAHRGTITLRSELGKGSTFTLWLPLHQVRTGEPAAV